MRNAGPFNEDDPGVMNPLRPGKRREEDFLRDEASQACTAIQASLRRAGGSIRSLTDLPRVIAAHPAATACVVGGAVVWLALRLVRGVSDHQKSREPVHSRPERRVGSISEALHVAFKILLSTALGRMLIAPPSVGSTPTMDRQEIDGPGEP